MIQDFVKRWEERKHEVRAKFQAELPDYYASIVRAVVEILHDEDGYETPDPERITETGWGDCQGTQVFVIGAGGYQPSSFWYVKVSYGSCSGCDTLRAVIDSSDNKKQKVDDLMTLALHIVQGIKEMEDESV